MNLFNAHFFSALALAVAGQLPLASATTFYERPFPEVVQDAPIIVRGVIGNSYADWSKGEDGTKRIYTFLELQLSEVLRGQLDGRSMLVRQIGGEKDGVGLQVAGAAHFARGEDVVVFVGLKNPDGSHELQGMTLGKMNVEKDDEGREVLEGGAASGMSHENDGHAHAGGHQEQGKTWTLDTLRKIVREQDSQKTASNQNITPSAVKSPSEIAVTAVGASQLQPPSGSGAETPASSSENLFSGLRWGGLGVLVLAVLIWGRLRRSR